MITLTIQRFSSTSSTAPNWPGSAISCSLRIFCAYWTDKSSSEGIVNLKVSLDELSPLSRFLSGFLMLLREKRLQKRSFFPTFQRK
jgi:hypothetical protein